MTGWLASSSKEKTRIVGVPARAGPDDAEVSPWVWRAQLKLEGTTEAAFTAGVGSFITWFVVTGRWAGTVTRGVHITARRCDLCLWLQLQRGPE